MLDQPGEIGNRQVGAGDDGHRHVGDQADRGEARDRVVGQVPVHPAAGGLGEVDQEQRVAVRRRLRDPAGTQCPAGAGDVLDRHLPAEIAGHGPRNETGQRVGRATGRERHHDP